MQHQTCYWTLSSLHHPQPHCLRRSLRSQRYSQDCCVGRSIVIWLRLHQRTQMKTCFPFETSMIYWTSVYQLFRHWGWRAVANWSGTRRCREETNKPHSSPPNQSSRPYWSLWCLHSKTYPISKIQGSSSGFSHPKSMYSWSSRSSRPW